MVIGIAKAREVVGVVRQSIDDVGRDLGRISDEVISLETRFGRRSRVEFRTTVFNEIVFASRANVDAARAAFDVLKRVEGGLGLTTSSRSAVDAATGGLDNAIKGLEARVTGLEKLRTHFEGSIFNGKDYQGTAQELYMHTPGTDVLGSASFFGRHEISDSLIEMQSVETARNAIGRLDDALANAVEGDSVSSGARAILNERLRAIDPDLAKLVAASDQPVEVVAGSSAVSPPVVAPARELADDIGHALPVTAERVPSSDAGIEHARVTVDPPVVVEHATPEIAPAPEIGSEVEAVAVDIDPNDPDLALIRTTLSNSFGGRSYPESPVVVTQ